jgi:D-alanine-D-alanine ligase
MGSSSSVGARRQRVAVIADGVAEMQEHLESALPGGLTAVRDALVGLGFEPVVVEFAGDPSSWLAALREGGFDVVFNLCEGLGGQGSEEALPASAVELLGLPMTGARAFTLGLCSRKDLVNAHLRAQGIAVPDWGVARAGEPFAWRRYPAIVKPVAEDASLGIDPGSVVHSRAELEAARSRGHETWERLLVQRFVDGREINVAIVGDRVLPHSEIDFALLPRGLPRVVTYAAKWETGSVYDRGTMPRLLGADEGRLSARLARVAQAAWAAVEGSGYARIDLRLGERGRLYVIDVNPNADLSPDAGLARQAAAAGWSYQELIARILDLAFTTQDPRARQRGTRRAAVPA